MSYFILAASFLAAATLIAIVSAVLVTMLSVESPSLDDPPTEHESILARDIEFKFSTGRSRAIQGEPCRYTYGGEVTVVDESHAPIPSANVGLIFFRNKLDGEQEHISLTRKTSNAGHAYVRDCMWEQKKWESVILHVSAEGHSSKTLVVEESWQELKTVILRGKSYGNALNSDAGKAGAG